MRKWRDSTILTLRKKKCLAKYSSIPILMVLRQVTLKFYLLSSKKKRNFEMFCNCGMYFVFTEFSISGLLKHFKIHIGCRKQHLKVFFF